MTLRHKYKSLNNRTSVKRMIVNSVYNTMQMEGQFVPMKKVESLYKQVMKERGEKPKKSLQTR